MKQILPLLCLSALLLTSCSKSSSPTSNNNTNGGGNNAATNQVLATVDGKAITFKTLGNSGSYASGIASFAIAGIDSVSGISFAIGGGGFITSGTYDLGLQSISPAYAFAVSYNYTSGGDSFSYGSNSSNTSKVGTITISSISATGAKGTFTATLPLLSGASGAPSTVTITNGQFNVSFQ